MLDGENTYCLVTRQLTFTKNKLHKRDSYSTGGHFALLREKRNAAFLTVSSCGSGSRRHQHVNGERTQKFDAWNFKESTFDSSTVCSGKQTGLRRHGDELSEIWKALRSEWPLSHQIQYTTADKQVTLQR